MQFLICVLNNDKLAREENAVTRVKKVIFFFGAAAIVAGFLNQGCMATFFTRTFLASSRAYHICSSRANTSSDAE